MSAWGEARRLGRQSRAIAQGQRAAPGNFDAALPDAADRFRRQVCVYCQGMSGRKVGRLAITGPVVYCKDHTMQYKTDKVWEAKHKRETGE